MEKSLVFVVVRLDGAIYDIVHSYFYNAHVLRGYSNQQLIEAYKAHGLHDLDFGFIYG